MKKVLILLVMVFAINVTAQETALLRLNYKKGDSYSMNMKMSQDMGEAMSMDISINMTQSITDVIGETYVSEMKITQMSMDMNQQGMNMSYDSTKNDDELDAGGIMIKSQLEPILQAVITSKGNNLGEVFETTIEPNIANVSDFTNQTGNVVYPIKAVKVGENWTVSKTDKGMDMNFVYTVKSITKENVLVDVSGKISGGAEGTIIGDMKIDRNSGVPLISNVYMNMNVQGQALSTKMTAIMTKQ